ncbi:MAG: PIN domain-containing protein [Micrococcales bacterium]|nr:PIN domain-containing protein [Micrococcales bacterium]
MIRAFVDTNVLLYAYDPSAGDRHVIAADLVEELALARCGVVSVQVLQEFYVNAVSKIATPLTPEQAQARIRALSLWPVHSPMADDVLAAAQLARGHQVSFWDAMILHSAAAMGCQTLWTEDLNSTQRVGSVTVRNPFDR